VGRPFMKKRHILIAGLAFSLAGTWCASAYAQKKPKIVKVKPDKNAKKKPAAPAESAEPDKVLYDKALLAVKHSRFIEARLDFQTLINTYPDSEYLAKAKLGVADSFYKEGGESNLTQAIEEYKNFEVFFPFLDEASYAQMQVGMAHYKLMEKADRDNSHAEAAEDEFREFLAKYPQSPYVPQAEQSMRNVQEVLAQGEFGIARFYYTKKDYRASAARLVEVSSRYPLFSQSDDALWMLGDIYERAKQLSKNEDDKNHWADLASKCYDRIVQDYPSSELTAGAKAQLKAMGMPIPAPSPEAIQRMKQEQLYARQHHELAVLKGPKDMVSSAPDVSAAAHSGAPNLAPPDDTVSPLEVLNQGAAGPSFTVVAAGGSPEAGGDKAGTADSESVETDSSVSSGAAPITTAPATAAGVQIIDTPGATTSSDTVPANSSPAPASASPAPAAPSTDAAAAVATVSPAAAVATAPASATTATTAAQTGTSTSQPASGANAAPATADKADPDTESTSKKKKGLHKLIPF
jgi:outer membrane protein assembly factor BamD